LSETRITNWAKVTAAAEASTPIMTATQASFLWSQAWELLRKIVLSGNRRHPQKASHLNWKNDDKTIGIPGIHFQASSDECEPKKTRV
jgi:hypothetical protein